MCIGFLTREKFNTQFFWQFYTIAKFLKNIFTVIAVNSYLRFFLKRWTSIIIILAILRSIKHFIYKYNILIIGFSIIGKHFLDNIVKKKIVYWISHTWGIQYTIHCQGSACIVWYIIRGQDVSMNTSSGVELYWKMFPHPWDLSPNTFIFVYLIK